MYPALTLVAAFATAASLSGCANLEEVVINHPDEVGQAIDAAGWAINPIGTAANKTLNQIGKMDDLSPEMQQLASVKVPPQELTIPEKSIGIVPIFGKAALEDNQLKLQKIEFAKHMTTNHPDIPGFYHKQHSAGKDSWEVAAIWDPSDKNPDKINFASTFKTGDEDANQSARWESEKLARQEVANQIKGLDPDEHKKTIRDLVSGQKVGHNALLGLGHQ